jgi:hypothetical protein
MLERKNSLVTGMERACFWSEMDDAMVDILNRSDGAPNSTTSTISSVLEV